MRKLVAEGGKITKQSTFKADTLSVRFKSAAIAITGDQGDPMSDQPERCPSIAELSLEIQNLAHLGWADKPNLEYLFREIGKRAQKISELTATSAPPEPYTDHETGSVFYPAPAPASAPQMTDREQRMRNAILGAIRVLRKQSDGDPKVHAKMLEDSISDIASPWPPDNPYEPSKMSNKELCECYANTYQIHSNPSIYKALKAGHDEILRRLNCGNLTSSATQSVDLEKEWLGQSEILSYRNWLQATLLKDRTELERLSKELYDRDQQLKYAHAAIEGNPSIYLHDKIHHMRAEFEGFRAALEKVDKVLHTTSDSLYRTLQHTATIVVKALTRKAKGGSTDTKNRS